MQNEKRREDMNWIIKTFNTVRNHIVEVQKLGAQYELEYRRRGHILRQEAENN